MFAVPFSVVVGAGLVGFAPSGACVAAGDSALQHGPPVLIDAILAAGPQRLAAQARRAGKSGWTVRKSRGLFFQDGGGHPGRPCRAGWFALRVLF